MGIPYRVNSFQNRSSARSDQFNPVDFDTFGALAGRETDALLGVQDRKARPPKRAGMAINIAPAIVRHHEAETLLIVEEFDPSIDHRAAGTRIAATSAVWLIASKAIAAAEAVGIAAEAIAPSYMVCDSFLE